MGEDKIVRCYSCAGWVRSKATSTQPTGTSGYDEIWCLQCLRAVDEYTEECLPSADIHLDTTGYELLLEPINQTEQENEDD